jgi:hypothetical protein
MRRIFDIVVVIGCLIGAAGTAVPASAADICTCRAPGKRVELGGTTCLQTPRGPRLARCVVDVNIMSWQILDTPCPISFLPDGVPRAMTVVHLAPPIAATAR